MVSSFRGMGFQFQRNEWVFSLRGMGFLTIFKLDVGEEHEDEDDIGCWGRTRFGIVRVSFRFQVKVKFRDFQ